MAWDYKRRQVNFSSLSDWLRQGRHCRWHFFVWRLRNPVYLAQVCISNDQARRFPTPGFKRVMAKVKVFKSRSNFKVKVTRSKIIVPCESSCHKEYTCAIWKPYLFWFVSYGQDKSFFQTLTVGLWHELPGRICPGSLKSPNAKYAVKADISWKQ